MMMVACGTKTTTKTMRVDTTGMSEWQARGAEQVARLWTEEDGTQEELQTFVETQYLQDKADRERLLLRMQRILEAAYRSGDELQVLLQEPTVQSDKGEPMEIDWALSGYNPMGHLTEDLFANKVAFVCALNFPQLTLEEKGNPLSGSPQGERDYAAGEQDIRMHWAEARLGDMFAKRVPAKVSMRLSEVEAETDNYISAYNIMMHQLRTDDGRQLWPEPMALLAHWNLRDELKSCYADSVNGQEKQEMVYEVMKRIIRQEIPSCVINNAEYTWKPYANVVTRNEKQETRNEMREPDTRYEMVLKNFRALQEEDKYCGNTYIERRFDEQLEMSKEEVEQMFQTLVGSEQVKQVGALIRERLGRNLRPYDIWYDGFKTRSTMSEDKLTAETRKRYPNAAAFKADMPRMLENLGFSKESAAFLQAHIEVDPARGSGHARPCVGKGESARLRTRIGEQGMDYKGYNIAVHEFGHNVEEVTSLYEVDHWLLAGIPNEGFTEAAAFLFQQRDLQLLGYGKQPMDAMSTLDMLWSQYEIMGVCLVDIRMWEWLYAHKNATAAELREAVLQISAEVWNQYYEPILGEKDCPLLGIYSHMICYPLYLPGYPIGHLVQYQLEEYLAKLPNDQAFIAEWQRIYRQGRLTPDAWMIGATGEKLSVEPILRAVNKIIGCERGI